MKLIGGDELGALLAEVCRTVTRPERLYLVAGTSLLAEGARPGVPHLELAGGGADGLLAGAVRAAADARGIALVWESPADVIPLPHGWEARARPVAPRFAAAGPLEVVHFDPYSVALRLIARGDEADYVAVVEYVRLGWIEREQLEALHLEVVPRFTSETLAQDPAEFRRKFRGLRQVLVRDLDRRRDAAHEPPVAARMT